MAEIPISTKLKLAKDFKMIKVTADELGLEFWQLTVGIQETYRGTETIFYVTLDEYPRLSGKGENPREAFEDLIDKIRESVLLNEANQ